MTKQLSLLIRRTSILALGVMLVGLSASRSPARAASSDSPFPVRVSMNGRYLEDANGKPFLLHGDTAWSVIVQLTKEEAEEYLEDRRQKGFNAILVNLTYVNEAYYEDTRLVPGAGTPALLRAQAYWALLSGAAGHLFGSDRVWAFGAHVDGKPDAPQYDWRAGMESQGSRDMVHVKRLFESRAWHELVPDQDHTVVTNGYGTFEEDDRKPGGDYVTAARTGDGSLVMAYVPSTGTESRTITVNMTSLSGAANARWYNPTSGKFSGIPGSPLANSGSREFTTPGDNGTGTNDWVLVLETRAAD